MRKKYIDLQHFTGDAQIIDRTGAESLIPVEESKEIIQGVVTSSAVLSRGRKLLVLLSAVLDSLCMYFMLCFSLPIQVVEAISKRRHTFL